MATAETIVPDPAARGLAFAQASMFSTILIEAYGERNASAILSATIAQFVEQSLDD